MSNSPVQAQDLTHLSRLRDELALQAHLFKAEAQDLWRDAESRWERLQEEVAAVRNAVERSTPELKAASALMAESLQKTYADLRNALRH